MIRINLLPHREAARKRRREAYHALLGAAALAGGLCAGVVLMWFDAQISTQQSKNALLQSENARLDNQVKQIATLEQEIAALRARQQAVEDLQADRNLPVHLLNELTAQLPDGVYINKMTQEGLRVTLQGVAQSNERVSELLRNLSGASPWFSRPELVEIVAGTVMLSPRDQRRVANFTLRVGLNRPAPNDVASGVLAPASAASKPLAARTTGVGTS